MNSSNNDELVDQLMRRLDVLEAEKRRWRRVGIGASVLLVLLFLGGSLVIVGLGSVWFQSSVSLRQRAEMEEERARMQMMQAQMLAEQARRNAENAQREAKEKAEAAKEQDKP